MQQRLGLGYGSNICDSTGEQGKSIRPGLVPRRLMKRESKYLGERGSVRAERLAKRDFGSRLGRSLALPLPMNQDPDAFCFHAQADVNPESRRKPHAATPAPSATGQKTSVIQRARTVRSMRPRCDGTHLGADESWLVFQTRIQPSSSRYLPELTAGGFWIRTFHPSHSIKTKS